MTSTDHVCTEFITSFAPETWTHALRGKEFMGLPFHLDGDLRLGVGAVISHQDKYCLLPMIANEFASVLDDDEAELDPNGYTPATRPSQTIVDVWRSAQRRIQTRSPGDRRR